MVNHEAEKLFEVPRSHNGGVKPGRRRELAAVDRPGRMGRRIEGTAGALGGDCIAGLGYHWSPAGRSPRVMQLVQRCHGDRAEVQVNTAARRCIMTTQCMGADVWPLNRKAGEVNKGTAARLERGREFDCERDGCRIPRLEPSTSTSTPPPMPASSPSYCGHCHVFSLTLFTSSLSCQSPSPAARSLQLATRSSLLNPFPPLRFPGVCSSHPRRVSTERH